MENRKVSFKSAIYLIIVLELLIALSINLFEILPVIRIFAILLAVAGFILYFKQIKKINVYTIVFFVISLLYGVSVLPILTSNFDFLSVISIVLSFASVAWVGFTIGLEEKTNKFLYAIFGSMLVFGIVSLFITLYEYGFFFAVSRDSNTLEHSTKMWILGYNPFHKDARVMISFFGLPLSLLSSGLVVSLRHKKIYKEDINLRKIALYSGVFGVISLLLMPYLIGIAVTVCSTILTLVVFYFPQDKKKRLVLYIFGGVAIIGVLGVIVLKGDSVVRIRVGLNVLRNIFAYPLGGQPSSILEGTPNTRNIYLDTIFYNGIPSLLILLGLTVVSFIVARRYYKLSNDTKIKKDLILSYLIYYFVYVNLNYSQQVFGIQANDLPMLPVFLEPTMLIVLFITGYMLAKTNKVKLENNI